MFGAGNHSGWTPCLAVAAFHSSEHARRRDATSIPKNILIFSDNTGQAGGLPDESAPRRPCTLRRPPVQFLPLRPAAPVTPP